MVHIYDAKMTLFCGDPYTKSDIPASIMVGYDSTGMEHFKVDHVDVTKTFRGETARSDMERWLGDYLGQWIDWRD